MDLTNKKAATSNDESAEDFEFAENFINTAREMYADANSNPPREGCFPAIEIRQMAISTKLPDDAVMEHLFDCSECFREYRRALAAAKDLNLENKKNWRDLFKVRTAKLAFAGFSFALIAAFLLFAYFALRERNTNDLAKNIESPNIAAPLENSQVQPAEKKTEADGAERNLNASPSNNQSNRQQSNLRNNEAVNSSKNKTENQKSPSADEVALDLILSDDSTLRNSNANRTNEKDAPVLPARRLRLNIKVSPNYADGNYKITIVDAFNKPLSQQNAAIKNGVLAASLDLKNLEKRANKLCLQKNDAMPDCFNIKIVK